MLREIPEWASKTIENVTREHNEETIANLAINIVNWEREKKSNLPSAIFLTIYNLQTNFLFFFFKTTIVKETANSLNFANGIMCCIKCALRTDRSNPSTIDRLLLMALQCHQFRCFGIDPSAIHWNLVLDT